MKITILKFIINGSDLGLVFDEKCVLSSDKKKNVDSTVGYSTPKKRFQRNEFNFSPWQL